MGLLGILGRLEMACWGSIRAEELCMLCVGVISMDVVMPLLENRRVNSAGLLDASWCVDDGSMRSGIFCKIVVV